MKKIKYFLMLLVVWLPASTAFSQDWSNEKLFCDFAGNQAYVKDGQIPGWRSFYIFYNTHSHAPRSTVILQCERMGLTEVFACNIYIANNLPVPYQEKRMNFASDTLNKNKNRLCQIIYDAFKKDIDEYSSKSMIEMLMPNHK